MKLDREYQKTILGKLLESYPTYESFFEWFKAQPDTDKEKYAANMLYLEGHGLVISRVQIGIDRRISIAIPPELTSKGIDFISDDGGLSAILGTVTVKLHDETIRNLIETKIMLSNLPHSDKRKFVDALKQLPAESIKHLTMKILDLGLSNWDKVFQLMNIC